MREARALVSASNDHGRTTQYAAQLHVDDGDGGERAICPVMWGYESSLSAEEAWWFESELHDHDRRLYAIVRRCDRWKDPQVDCYVLGASGPERCDPPPALSEDTLRDTLKMDAFDSVY